MPRWTILLTCGSVMAVVIALTAAVTARLVGAGPDPAVAPSLSEPAPEPPPAVAPARTSPTESPRPEAPAPPIDRPVFDAAAQARLARVAVEDPRRFVRDLSNEQAVALAELLQDRVYLNSDRASMCVLPADHNLSSLPHLDRRLALTADQQARIEEIKEQMKPRIEVALAALWKEYSFNQWTLRHMSEARTTGILDGQKLTREQRDDLGRQWSTLNGETQGIWREITEAKRPLDEMYYQRVRRVLTRDQAGALDDQRARFPH